MKLAHMVGLSLALVGCAEDVLLDEEGAPAALRGERGATGARGPRGLPGASWSPVTYEVEALERLGDVPGEVFSATAQCDEGDRVATGSCQWGELTASGVYVLARPFVSGPIFDGEAWQCAAVTVDQATIVRAVATCIEAE